METAAHNPDYLDVNPSKFDYEFYRSGSDGGIRTGLYDEDLRDALNSPDTIFVAQTGHEEDGRLPLLVPVESLEWYNLDLLKKTYGSESKIYFYADPPLAEDQVRDMAIGILSKELDEGAIILSELNRNRIPNVLDVLAENNFDYTLESVGGETPRSADIFVGEVIFEGTEKVEKVPSLFEVYKHGVSSGEYDESPANGFSLVESISGEEAKRIWEFYEKEFEELGEEHPMHAGFAEEDLLAFLADPQVVKAVNRTNGDITTVCLVMEDFNQCPWFNEEYYRREHPEYEKTGNILIFPSIVTDGSLKGRSYSIGLISMISRIAEKRGSNVLITFECTEVSSTYIPRIVTRAINSTGTGSVTGLESPASSLDYKVLRKTSSV